MLKGRQWNESSWELLRSVVAMRTSGIAAKFVLKMAIDLSLNDTTKRVIYVSIDFVFFFKRKRRSVMKIYFEMQVYVLKLG